jgi:hypothetical protein
VPENFTTHSDSGNAFLEAAPGGLAQPIVVIGFPRFDLTRKGVGTLYTHSYAGLGHNTRTVAAALAEVLD